MPLNRSSDRAAGCRTRQPDDHGLCCQIRHMERTYFWLVSGKDRTRSLRRLRLTGCDHVFQPPRRCHPRTNDQRYEIRISRFVVYYPQQPSGCRAAPRTSATIPAFVPPPPSPPLCLCQHPHFCVAVGIRFPHLRHHPRFCAAVSLPPLYSRRHPPSAPWKAGEGCTR